MTTKKPLSIGAAMVALFSAARKNGTFQVNEGTYRKRSRDRPAPKYQSTREIERRAAQRLKREERSAK